MKAGRGDTESGDCSQSSRWQSLAEFAALLGASFIVPFVHTRVLDHAIEFARAPVLIPLEYLMLRWFGQLSWWLPVGVVAQWFIGLRIVRLHSPGAIVISAIGLCAAIGAYLFLCASLLAIQLSAH